MASRNFRFIIINVLVTLILAGLLEMMVWLGLRFPEAVPEFLLAPYRSLYLSQDRSIIQVTDCARYDPELFYTLRPGDCVFENREFAVENRVNSAGVRDDEYSLRSPSIIALGDSYTMGWGVAQQESFPQVLEKMSMRKVLNAGVSSYGTAREMIMLKRLDTRRMDYLIIQYHHNDYEENAIFQAHNNGLPVRSAAQYDSLRQAISERRAYFPFKYLTGISRAMARSWLKPSIPDTANPVREARAFLDVLYRAIPQHDSLRIIVFRTDLPERVREDRFTDALDSLIQVEPYAWYNITTFRTSEFLTQDDYFLLDDHINARGHAKIAQKLHQFVANETPALGTKILIRHTR